MQFVIEDTVTSHVFVMTVLISHLAVEIIITITPVVMIQAYTSVIECWRDTKIVYEMVNNFVFVASLLLNL